MQPRFLIGNWKSNMTIAETTEWFRNVKCQMSNVKLSKELTIVLCVPFTVLSKAKELIKEYHLPIELGAQDVSPFGKGPYTGEISAEMIKELASYVLVGHSERRQYFEESDEERAFQVLQAKTAGLSVIFCVSDGQEVIPDSVDIVAYEPSEAIGSGKPEDPEQTAIICSQISERTHKIIVYGGSVTDAQASQYMKINDINGLLIGGASLDPETFFRIAEIYSKEL